MNMNYVTLQGNLVRDPEVKYVGSGIAVSEFTLAHTARSGEKEFTSFVDVKAWKGMAEKMKEYRKGNNLTVLGALRMDEWIDKKTDQKRTKLYVNAQVVTSTFTGERSPDASTRPPSRRRAPAREPEPEPKPSEDDVPF